MKSPINIQDGFLNQVRREGVPVTAHLTTGHHLKGTVQAFDSFTVVLRQEDNQGQVLIYKHALATLIPDRYLSLHGPENRQSS